jgi:hypothetical protein
MNDATARKDQEHLEVRLKSYIKNNNQLFLLGNDQTTRSDVLVSISLF